MKHTKQNQSVRSRFVLIIIPLILVTFGLQACAEKADTQDDPLSNSLKENLSDTLLLVEKKATLKSAFLLHAGSREAPELLDDWTMPESFQMEVPVVMQEPELPTGCESVALTNALLYHEFELEKTTIADEWLPLSDEDFVYAFLGDPHDPSANSTMAPCITNTANAYLKAQESEMSAYDISGLEFEELLEYVGQGYPVIAWNTILQEEAGEPYLTQVENEIEYGLYHNSHCVVLAGFDMDKNIVYVSDSLAGYVEVDRDVFIDRYKDLGSQAVLIA